MKRRIEGEAEEAEEERKGKEEGNGLLCQKLLHFRDLSQKLPDFSNIFVQMLDFGVQL